MTSGGLGRTPSIQREIAMRRHGETEWDVAEQKRQEAALGHTEESFRLLVENVKDYAIFMLDPQGNIVSWNAGAKCIKGYGADEIIGRHFSCFYPKEAIEQGWPEHELAVASSEGRFEDEGWRVRKGRAQILAGVVLNLHSDAGRLKGFSKITRDLTGHRRAERKFRGLLESAPDAVVIVDARGEIRLVNTQTEKLFGFTREELIGQPIEILVPESMRAKHVQQRDDYIAQPVGRPMGLGTNLYAVKKDRKPVPRRDQP